MPRSAQIAAALTVSRFVASGSTTRFSTGFTRQLSQVGSGTPAERDDGYARSGGQRLDPPALT